MIKEEEKLTNQNFQFIAAEVQLFQFHQER